MTPSPTIGFAGMTHLGLNSAVAAAQKGSRVVGFDPDAALIARLQSGATDITEPDLPELLRANAPRLQFTSAINDLCLCDIVYISLDVPTDDQGASNLTPIHSMIEAVNRAIASEALLVVLCQVPPGFTRNIKRDPTRLYYQVETLIFGRAIERALYPERYIIGCADPASGIHPIFQAYLEAYGCPILPMRYESAELAKTAINLFLAAQVCTANTLAEICEKIGADWQEIIPSLHLDRRIGPHAYIHPGLGLSGGNIERDLKTVSQIGYEAGARVNVPMAYIEHSQYRKKWSIRQFFAHYDSARVDFTVAVLGLAYKANTHSVKNSPAVDLIEATPDIRINVYDPVVRYLASGKNVRFCKTAVDAAKSADIVFLMTPWDAFKMLDWQALAASMRGKVLVDPYRIMPESACPSLAHIVLGRS